MYVCNVCKTLFEHASHCFHCNLFKNALQQTGESVIQLGFMLMSIELMKAINSTLHTLPQIDMINRLPTQPYRCRYEFLDLLKFAKLLQSMGMNSDQPIFLKN